MTKHIINWFRNILLIFLLVAACLMLFHSYLSKEDRGQPTSIFGFKMMTVLSGSMEPNLFPGDIIISKQINPTKIKVDDVITYQDGQDTLVTHRVINVVKKEGKTFFQTQGDANNIADEKLISTDQFVGKLQFQIPKAGFIMQFFKSTLGTMILVTAIVFLLGLKPLMKVLTTGAGKDKKDVTI